jgi:hypothetical protein
MKIPGTFIDLKLQFTDEDSDTINLKLMKNNEEIANEFIRDFMEIEPHIVNTLSRYNISLPKPRFENLMSQLEGEYQNLAQESSKRQARTSQRQQASTQALSQMSNLHNIQKFLLMGLSNAGKTSIFEVIFMGKMPHETKILTPTIGSERHEINFSWDQKKKTSISIWDLGGQKKFLERYYTEPELFFGEASTLLFVIDAYNVDLYEESRYHLHQSVKLMKKYGIRPLHLPKSETHIFCLLHKMDQFGANREDQYKALIDYFRYNPETKENSTDILFFSTSIFDSSVYSTWTKIMQRILPKSTKLNLIAQNFKEDLKLYATLVIEKRTGLPICASRTLLDDAALVGSTNRIMMTIEKVLPEFELTNLQRFTIQTSTGNISVEIFEKYYCLVLIYPDSFDINQPKVRDKINILIEELKNYI